MTQVRLALLATIALAALVGCLRAPSPEPPPAPREFRAAWVATVANIDWPSRPGLSAPAQRQEARKLIDRARSLGLNALIFQVRPAADALYDSPYEPWSEFLTGTQGQSPGYDPLAFWVQEAHAAGLELHAWFNPYRVRPAAGRSPLAPRQVANTRPDLVRAYGSQLWLDPGEPAAAELVLQVILDVVRRYDVDGVHVDDYFYPYPVKDEAGQPVPFPDEPPWQRYLAGGGTLERADWRRHNVDTFVERLYRGVHGVKPQVRVGISPFGLGRPELRPPGVKGFSQYDELYADVEGWLAKGWLDYLAPQLYWLRDAPGQPFAVLLEAWHQQNPLGRHLWPGLFTSRVGLPEPWPAEEILGQIRTVRAQPGSTGHAHFSMVALSRPSGPMGAPLAAFYGGPALVPATPWLGGEAPPVPAAQLLPPGPGDPALRVVLDRGPSPWLLAVWARYGQAWRFFTLPGAGGSLPAQWEGVPLGAARLSAVGPTGLESPSTPLPIRGNP